MAIKIEEKKPEIPVEIGPLKFTFVVTDESVLKFRKNGAKIQRELEKVELVEDDDEKALEQTRDILRRGFDLFLGDGAFEKIYNLTPSIPFLLEYFAQLSEGLHAEIEALGANEAVRKRAEKYIKKKK